MRRISLFVIALLVPSLSFATPGLRFERTRDPLVTRGLSEQARGVALQTRGSWLISIGEQEVGDRFAAEGARLLRNGAELEALGEQRERLSLEHKAVLRSPRDEAAQLLVP